MNILDQKGEIISAARITARPEKRKELCMTITSLLDPIRSQEGCRDYRFYGEASGQDSFMLIGEWETRVHWEQHVRSEPFAVLLGSLELLSAERCLDVKLFSQVDKTVV